MDFRDYLDCCTTLDAIPAWHCCMDTEGRHCEEVLLHGSRNLLDVIPTKAEIQHKAR
ncbi:MAG: hypothetical protein PG979_001055 [Rickettsia asembonensis]|nr:MAG: hypothetical protein PG979_001055 [Rickettsia asembonensis]